MLFAAPAIWCSGGFSSSLSALHPSDVDSHRSCMYRLFIYLFIYLPIYLSTYLLIYWSTYLFTYRSIYLAS